MPDQTAERGDLDVAVERLTEAVHTSVSDAADAAAVLVNVGDLRRLLRAVEAVREEILRLNADADYLVPKRHLGDRLHGVLLVSTPIAPEGGGDRG